MVLTIVHYRNRKEREHYMVLGKNPDSTLVGKCGFSVPVMLGIREFAQGDLGGRKTGYFLLT